MAVQPGALRLTEIFYSLQGETSFTGLPTVFVRLTGCPLRCQYCDSEYAFHGGSWHSFEDMLTQIATYPTKHITVSGGEPLAQKNVLPFLTLLCDKGYIVSLETSGAMPVQDVDSRVVKILDIKTPGSAESDKNLWANLDFLTEQDEIKFVICDRADFEWAADIVKQHTLTERHTVWFSPSANQQNPTELANWILEAQLPVRLQLQLHKILWGDIPGK